MENQSPVLSIVSATAGSETTHARATKNKAFFREVNQWIAELSITTSVGLIDFLCECSHLSCVERIPLTLEEYRAAHTDARHFLARRAHVDGQAQRVVADAGRYVVIERIGAAGDLSEALYPEQRPLTLDRGAGDTETTLVR